jgi:predicted metal-dependent hydrolase
LPSLDLGTRRIEYAVVRGTSRRYTYFRFREDLMLEVVIPRGSRVDVEKAIKERTPWLQREYNRLSRTRRILTRDSLMFGGEPLKIVIVNSPEDRLAPDPEKQEVIVFTGDQRRLRELVRRWFLKESSTYVVKKVAEFAPIVGVKARRVDVREINKWGYCTREGRLSFSWQLIALPERLREYVVLHELTHLVEFNHSSAFKRKLAAVCPDFRAREKELDLIVPYEKLVLS